MLSTRYISSLFTCAIAKIARFASLTLLLNIPFCVSYTYAQDTACGIIWHEPVVLMNDRGLPQIATEGNIVHLTWSSGYTKLPYMRSTTEGEQWSEVMELWNTPRSHASHHQIIPTSQSLYLFYQFVNDSTGKDYIQFIKSSNKGLSWNLPNQIFPEELSKNPVTINDDTIALGINYRPIPGYVILPVIASSTTGGNSWNFSTDTILGFVPVCALGSGALHVVMSATGIPLLSPEILYWKSTDLGFSWTKKMFLSSHDGAGSSIATVAAEGNNIIATWRDTKFGGCFSSLGCGIVSRRSDSGGEQWYDDQLLTEIQNGITSDVAIQGNIVASTWSGGNDVEYEVYARVSFDGGKTYCPVHHTGVPKTGDAKIAISPNAIHVVFSHAITLKMYYVRGEIVRTSVKEPIENIPSNIVLQQNYPNPFNPQTAISFKQSAVSKITIKIFDMFGKEVAILINNKQYEAGKYNVDWNAEEFASGMYFYRLTSVTNDGKQTILTQKMLLMK
ncbi:MAG: T9SS type A sorting domain-containing protein [Bacteroidota bacterium]